MTEPDATATIHQLRALTVELDLLGAQFARRHSLHPTDIRALICLLDADRGGIAATPGWLGTQLGLESASVTALIDRMTKRDLVSREPDPADRRRVRLRVTARASELGTAFFGPVIADALADLARRTPEQRTVIDDFLASMRRVVLAAGEQQTP